jgi:CMP-N-acetylneuraminic acid synthetase
MVVVGVIPARAGSKGIPGKNLALCAGRPLLAWTADAARDSGVLARVILSTDDSEIARMGALLGLEVPFLRPQELAGDDTPILPVLQHLIDALEERDRFQPSALVLLQPTSPLRRGEHIRESVQRLEQSGADSVVSVVEVPHQFNPLSVMREDHGRLVPFADGPTVTLRQHKPRLFARNGPAILAVRTETIRRGSLYGDDVRPLHMSPEESIDIDTPWDLDLADWLLRRRR